MGSPLEGQPQASEERLRRLRDIERSACFQLDALRDTGATTLLRGMDRDGTPPPTRGVSRLCDLGEGQPL